MDSEKTVPQPKPGHEKVGRRFSRRQLGFNIAVILLVLATMAAGVFIAGYIEGGRQHTEVLPQRDKLQQKVTELTTQLRDVEAQLEIYRHGGELERQASEKLRQENIDLQNRNSELERSVAFYKGIMVPSGGAKGLKIDRLEIDSTPNRNRFRVKVTLTQLADNRSSVSGSLKLTLLGIRDGEKTAIPFTKMAAEFAEDSGSFKFRYFQELVSEIVIPDGVLPDQIVVEARAVGRKATKLERTFDWNNREVTTDVGQGKG